MQKKTVYTFLFGGSQALSWEADMNFTKPNNKAKFINIKCPKKLTTGILIFNFSKAIVNSGNVNTTKLHIKKIKQ